MMFGKPGEVGKPEDVRETSDNVVKWGNGKTSERHLTMWRSGETGRRQRDI